jgi:hypothetical protein
MPHETIKKAQAILAETNVEGHCHSTLEACVKEDWTLVFEGYDIGPFVEHHWGDADYEYFLWVKPESVPKVLIELIKDHFSDDTAFREWLTQKGIEYQTWSHA